MMIKFYNLLLLYPATANFLRDPETVAIALFISVLLMLSMMNLVFGIVF